MSDLTREQEHIAALLGEHQPLPITETGLVHIGYGCPSPCEWGNEGGYDLDQHHAHVAAVLAEAGVGFVAEAERRGAEWALREAAHALQHDMDSTAGARPLIAVIPRWLRDRADRIGGES